jgi:hypothetical protein
MAILPPVFHVMSGWLPIRLGFHGGIGSWTALRIHALRRRCTNTLCPDKGISSFLFLLRFSVEPNHVG